MEEKVYPSWRYHKSEEPVVVQSAEQDAELGKGWADTPAAFEQEEEKKPRKQKAEKAQIDG